MQTQLQKQNAYTENLVLILTIDLINKINSILLCRECLLIDQSNIYIQCWRVLMIKMNSNHLTVQNVSINVVFAFAFDIDVAAEVMRARNIIQKAK